MTTSTRRIRRLATIGAVLGLAALPLAGAGAAQADHLPVVFSGQGLDDDGNIEEIICDDENTPYVLFVLTATQASSAEIDGAGYFLGGDMFRQGNQDRGAFKFVAEIGGDLTDLIDEVSATYAGAPQNAQLVISHGCPGGPSS